MNTRMQAQNGAYSGIPLQNNFGSTLFDLAGLPNPGCYENSNGYYTTTLNSSTPSLATVLNSVNIADYHVARYGETYTVDLTITNFNVLLPPVSFYYTYITSNGTEIENFIDSWVLNTDDFPLGSPTTVSATFTPTFNVGTQHAIKISLFAGQELFIPFVLEGPTSLEVPSVGIATLPQIPYLILRDPPGDKSFTSYTTSNTICREFTETVSSSTGMGTNFSATLGIAGSAGFIVTTDFEFSATVSGGLNVSESTSSTGMMEMCLTSMETINTSSAQDLGGIGRSADKFVGVSHQFLLGLYDYLKYDYSTCGAPYTEPTMTYARDTSYTPLTFKLTEQEIQNEIISLGNDIMNGGLSPEEENMADKQKKVFEDLLSQNDAYYLSTQNEVFEEGVRVDNAGDSKGYEITTNNSYTIETEATLDASAAVSLSFMVGGSGASASSEFTYSKTVGSSETESNSSTYQYNYTLDDDEYPTDEIYVRIERDPDFDAPLFRTLALPDHRTSCPYEGGYRIDQPRISGSSPNCPNLFSNIAFVDNIIGNEVEVKVQICNDGDETREFSLRVAGNNPNGISVEAGGNSIVNGDRYQATYIPGNENCEDVIVKFKKTTSAVVYEDIELILFPSCGGDNVAESEEAVSVEYNLYFGQSGPSSMIDSDCDGVINANDNCPGFDDNVDADVDGLADACDNCPSLAQIGLDFNENNDYVEISHDPVFNNLVNDAFSFEAWIYSDLNNAETILSKGPSTLSSDDLYLFQVNPNGEGKIGLELGTLDHGGIWLYSDTALPPNQWNHVAVSVGNQGLSASVIFYLNGVQDGFRFANVRLNSSDNNPLFIARQGLTCPSNCGNNFDGTLDEVRIWGKALTQAEIQANMDNSLIGNESDLVAYYTFNEGMPEMDNTALATVIDISGNGHDGTLTNMALSGGSSNWVYGAPVNFIDANNNGIGDLCEDACPPDYANGNSLTGSETGTIIYTSGGLIQSTQTIATGADVEYNAGTDIELNPDFEVEGGAVFHAYIDGCGS